MNFEDWGEDGRSKTWGRTDTGKWKTALPSTSAEEFESALSFDQFCVRQLLYLDFSALDRCPRPQFTYIPGSER